MSRGGQFPSAYYGVSYFGTPYFSINESGGGGTDPDMPTIYHISSGGVSSVSGMSLAMSVATNNNSGD